MGSIKETERSSHQEPRGQGDIIRLEWPAGHDGPPLGIVINADCDLAHGKTDGVIAYVPIYPFREYLARFWAPGHVSEISAAATKSILKLIGDNEPDALHIWLQSSGPDAIALKVSELQKLKKKDADQLAVDLRRLA
ncbi:hypothetical protein EOA25_32695, partial [Mesorhizobium sp. M2A.F.Ca.ET.040.01.1.1]